jgi:hypothetical protein
VTECKHKGCNRNQFRRQLCSAHYRRLMGYTCHVTDCERVAYQFGLCGLHLVNPDAPAKPPRKLQPLDSKPLTKAENAEIDLDDFWDWVKIELGLESNKKITTKKTAHKP